MEDAHGHEGLCRLGSRPSVTSARGAACEPRLEEEEAHTHGGSVLGIQPGAGRANVVTNNICLSVADGTAAGRMTNVCYFKHTEISTCLVGRPTDAWSGQTRLGRGTVETVPSFPTEQL